MIYIKNPIRHSQVHESTSYVFMEQVKETLNVAVPHR